LKNIARRDLESLRAIDTRPRLRSSPGALQSMTLT
jgi:hypothetical protein